MSLQELNEIDLDNIADWPITVKLLLVAIVSLLVLLAGYFFAIQGQHKQLSREQATEQDLRKRFELAHARAANLHAYKAQLVEMRASFAAMLRQLPDHTEVADLLMDVSQTGLAAGLRFELFQPQQEIPQEFYAELPIRLRVKGHYHAFGAFVSGLAALPRIVTIHDVVIKPYGKDNNQQLLTFEALAKTYRYLGEGKG